MLQHFETHDEKGHMRPTRWSTDTTTEVGLANITRYLQWVGQNMPGYDYRRKAKQLVRLADMDSVQEQ